MMEGPHASRPEPQHAENMFYYKLHFFDSSFVWQATGSGPVAQEMG
jgi:hypothetical protein